MRKTGLLLVTLPRVIKFNNIKALFNHLYSLKNNLRQVRNYQYEIIMRDIAILELLFATGMRVFEVSGLLKENIDFENKSIKINAKGDRERIIPICGDEAEKALKEYYSLFSTKSCKTPCFFVNRLGKRFSEQSIRFMIKKYVSSAKIEEHITPHMFRHSYSKSFSCVLSWESLSGIQSRLGRLNGGGRISLLFYLRFHCA